MCSNLALKLEDKERFFPRTLVPQLPPGFAECLDEFPHSSPVAAEGVHPGHSLLSLA